MKPARFIILVLATLIYGSLTGPAAAATSGWHTRKIKPSQTADSAVAAVGSHAVITTNDPCGNLPAADSIQPDPAPIPQPARVQDAPIAICGSAEIRDPERIAAFVRRNNKDFPVEIAEAYIRVGDRYGIRGDIALCQAIIETGWFRFADGTAVTPDQHNYCGMGVTSRGMKGCSFETIDDGATAHIQHLYAYACRTPLPQGEQLLDPRFKLVSRGVAPNWTDLSNRWAMNPNYGNQILRLYNQLQTYINQK